MVAQRLWFGRLLPQLSGGPFAGSNRQRLRLGLLGPPAIPWPKGCFGTIREFMEALVHVFPIPSTSFLLLHHQNCTSSTPKVRSSLLPRGRYAATKSPSYCAQPGVSTGSGAQGAAGLWAAHRREGGTKVPGILDQRSLTLWNPPQRDFVPVPGRILYARRAAGAGSERTPSGFPRSSQAAKGPRRVFSILFLPAGGLLEATCERPHPTAPCPTSALS